MQLACLRCGRIHHPPFAGGKSLKCPCGEKIDLEEFLAFQKIIEDIEDKQKFDEIQKAADEISSKIISGEFSKIDFEIAKEKLRDMCSEYFPERMYLFYIIYESRFKRLWEQFRGGEGAGL